MRTRILPVAAAGAGAAALIAPAHAQLFSQNFEADSTAQWTVNGGPSDELANFFFDYSTVGIPAAPNGIGTRGLKLQANLSSGIFGGFSVSPTGLDLMGDYTVTFDWWSNILGPFPEGAISPTQLSTFGVGTAGTTAQWPGGTQDSVWFGATGDGGSASDYRAYSTAAPSSYPAGSPVYAAPGGAINESNAYYSSFGGVSAPAAQLALFPQQSGVTRVGAAGMEWHEVVIAKSGDSVSWTIDGLLIATVDLTTVTLGGGNIFFGHSDTNATSTTDPNDEDLLFTLIDNVVVVPAPGAACGLALLGGLTALGRRGRETRAAGGITWSRICAP